MKIAEPIKAYITISGGVIYADFWQITKNSPAAEGKQDMLNSETPNAAQGFIITDNRRKLGDPTYVLRVRFRCASFGLNSIPFKYRLQSPSTFAANPDLGFYFGYTEGTANITTRGMNQFSWTIAPFVGVTSTTLGPGDVKASSPLAAQNSNSQVNPAISYGLNAIFARNTIGVSIGIGWDYNFGDHSADWTYQNKIWIGVGFSANLSMFN
jgi:hypothetical protein